MSQVSFYWLYKAPPSSVANNIINLILILTIWWCQCVQSSFVLLEKRVYYGQCVLSTNFVKLCTASFYTPRPDLPVTLGIFWLTNFAFHSPLMKRISFFDVLEGLVGLYRTVQLQLLCIGGWGIDLDYCDVEWFALERNWGHSVIFEITPKYCILHSFVDYEEYSISSKGFYPQ